MPEIKSKSISILSDIITYMKYAKYIPEIGRRETWEELCERNMAMHIRKYPQLRADIQKVYREFVIPKKVLPSMRSMQFAGRPIEVNPSRVYNCAYEPIDHVDAFSESMFLLLGGTGFGYSVQRSHVAQLPVLRGCSKRIRRFVVGDSIEGWSDAIKILMEAYFFGKAFPSFDYSDIRPKGAMLVTSGGKAPGPQPLKDCIHNITKVLDDAITTRGRETQLTTLEVHDIICYIADAVLAGGIRRAALICLFSPDDELMLGSKGNFSCSIEDMQMIDSHNNYSCEVVTKWGNKRYSVVLNKEVIDEQQRSGRLPWYLFEAQRGRANNSVVLDRTTTTEEQFDSIWEKIIDSHSGEPGVYFTNNKDWGTNPCCEIALRPHQFCNLTEVNVDDVESQEDLNARCRAGAFIGTLQAGYTDFHYLRDVWKETTEKDALIGVGMTGIGSGAVLKLNLEEAAACVRDENDLIASIIGVNAAARTTTIKPAGTSSLVLGSSSGIHAWHNDYYIRRLRVGKNEAIYKYLATNAPELVQDDYFRPDTSALIEVPQKAPEGAILRTESPFTLLERVRRFNAEWVKQGHVDGDNTHNVSCTISVKDDEWEKVGKWMWLNRFGFNGISVLPYDGGSYIQAPFEDISKEEFEKRYASLHSIDLSSIKEVEDNTNLQGELACAGGKCDVT